MMPQQENLIHRSQSDESPGTPGDRVNSRYAIALGHGFHFDMGRTTYITMQPTWHDPRSLRAVRRDKRLRGRSSQVRVLQDAACWPAHLCFDQRGGARLKRAWRRRAAKRPWEQPWNTRLPPLGRRTDTS